MAKNDEGFWANMGEKFAGGAAAKIGALVVSALVALITGNNSNPPSNS